MKLIIEIDNDMFCNPSNYPEYMFKKVVLNGKSLSEELEKIKTEMHKRIKIQYDACFGDEGDVYCFHKAYEVSGIIVDNVFEDYANILKN